MKGDLQPRAWCRAILWSLTLLAATAAGSLAQAAATLCISAPAIQFGNRAVGTSSTASATIANCGDQAWSFTSVGVDPASGSAFHPATTCAAGAMLSPDASCTASVVFAPVGLGQTSGGLWFGTTSTTPNVLFSFYGRGVDGQAGTAALRFAPASAQFAAQLVDVLSAPKTIMLANDGPAPLTLSRLVLTGANAFDFQRVNNTCAIGVPIAAGATCTLSLFFAPRAGGTRTANLVIDSPQLAALAVLPIAGVGVTSLPPPPANYGGTWWNAPAGSQSGWGINFAHQGDTLFATWFTFDAQGKPLWLVATANRTAGAVYAGTLYRVTGPAFDTVPFDSDQVVETPVGSATFTFANADDATFEFTVDGAMRSKSITRQLYSAAVPTCVWGGQPDFVAATNFQDLWWNAPAGSEAGWGLNVTHQGNTLFATWFTYGRDGHPWWLAAVAKRAAPGVYSGDLYTVTGPAYDAAVYDPATVVETAVGTATLTFTDGDHASFATTVDGVTQVRPITRQIFAAPGTQCR